MIMLQIFLWNKNKGENQLPYYFSKSKCCCGEPLIKKSTDFNNVALFFKNKDYSLKDVFLDLGDCGNCKANNLFTSNRQEGCVTVKEFFEKRFDRASSPFSKKFMYYKKQCNIFNYKEIEEGEVKKQWKKGNGCYWF